MTYQIPLVSMYIFCGWMAILHFNAYHLVPSFIVSIFTAIHLNNYYEIASKEIICPGFECISLKEILNSFTQEASRENENNPKPFAECCDMESYLNIVGDFSFPVSDNAEFPFSESKYARLPLRSMMCPKGMRVYRNTGKYI